jgi:uncharacterized protein YjbJ (UPF0337 family)
MSAGSQAKWEGRWDQFRGRVRQLWGHMMDDDIQQAQGNYERAIGLIKERTGLAIENIEQQLDEEQQAGGLKWEGRWDQLRGKVRELWGTLTDDDLAKAKGNYEQTVGLIKERTGLDREEIERRLNR